MKSTNPSQDTLFKTIPITMVVTFVLVASTLLLDNLLDRTAFETKTRRSSTCLRAHTNTHTGRTSGCSRSHGG
jgi:hypothetical protein